MKSGVGQINSTHPGVYRLLKWPGPICYCPTYQGGSCCLGRCSSQVCKHLFHLGQLLTTDVVCICIRWQLVSGPL